MVLLLYIYIVGFDGHRRLFLTVFPHVENKTTDMVNSQLDHGHPSKKDVRSVFLKIRGSPERLLALEIPKDIL